MKKKESESEKDKENEKDKEREREREREKQIGESHRLDMWIGQAFIILWNQVKNRRWPILCQFSL